MNQTIAAWLVILMAFIAANLPFCNQRLFTLIRLQYPVKPLGLRLLELVMLYGVVGVSGLFFEDRLGQIFPQNWEFYAITSAVFLTLAFPGFVFRYLLKRRT